ncbi:MAG: sugar phosphate nucleotidyltransferase [Oscillospiraceae bacterium]|nr:sugar phosphate nucleotidyltransferase [Oscillospiraceae bacterium]
MLKDISGFIIQKDASVFDAATAIDKNGHQIVFVCDGLKLLAAFSDGDLRRYILRSGDISAPVGVAANNNPIFLKSNEIAHCQSLIKENPYIRGIPIVNESGEIVSIVFSEHKSVRSHQKLNIPVVIMAGGKGARLAPFTDVLPKPLIPIGEKTITEHIMDQFIDYACNDFTLIVNHKKALIKAYFSETPCKGNLTFVNEEKFLGTGGGLKLLKGIVSSTFFMTNCDILIKADYGDILSHHKKSGALITMVCALKKVSVPYGTIELDADGHPVRLIEKPDFPILTNTGFYVIEPEFLNDIPDDEFIHITDLMQNLMDTGKGVSIYPINESGWLDMGQPQEMERMISHLERT